MEIFRPCKRERQISECFCVCCVVVEVWWNRLAPPDTVITVIYFQIITDWNITGGHALYIRDEKFNLFWLVFLWKYKWSTLKDLQNWQSRSKTRPIWTNQASWFIGSWLSPVKLGYEIKGEFILWKTLWWLDHRFSRFFGLISSSSLWLGVSTLYLIFYLGEKIIFQLSVTKSEQRK